jgi:excisionase family DNA binding protein
MLAEVIAMSSVDKDLIGTKEAAEILGYADRKRVVKLCEEGKLAGAFQPGGSAPGNHWRIPRSSVHAHRAASSTRPFKRIG